MLWFGFGKGKNAGIAQLVEHDLAKVGVASPSLVSRSKMKALRRIGVLFSLYQHEIVSLKLILTVSDYFYNSAV